MSSERSPLPTGGQGRLRGNRTRSYGSLVHSSISPVRQRRVEHLVKPGETLQGLALKYGVSMEQIKRANRLYTNDSIFLKKSLSIPVLTDFDTFNNGVPTEQYTSQLHHNNHTENQNASSEPTSGKVAGPASLAEEKSDLSPMDFLKRMDGLINQSKLSAVKKIQEGEKGLVCIEQLHPHRTSSHQTTAGSWSATSSARVNQQAILGAVPLTITKRAKSLRDREDEIFEL